MIYQRQASITSSEKDYIDMFGSIESSKSQCFNIGAGTWKHSCWNNIDLKPQSEAFAKIQAPCIFHDLVESKDLPIKENSAQLLYTSHVIEHLPDSNVINLLKSAFRVLKQGGIFRITTGPDAESDFDAILRKDKNWWYFYNENNPSNLTTKIDKSMTLYDYWLFHFATPRSIFSETPSSQKYDSNEIKILINKFSDDREYLQNIFTDGLTFNKKYPENHISWWSQDKLCNLLTNVGFSNVKRSSYGQSSNYLLRDTNYFDTTYPQISMYVEAVK